MSTPVAARSPVLSQALKLVRRGRGLSAAEVAERMSLNIRTYRHFEAGKTYLDFNRIQAFALATDSDPHAILAAVMLETPAFAVHAIDNKVMSVIMAGVRRFEERVGERMAKIEVSRFISAFRRAFDDLETDLALRDTEARRWLGGGAPSPARDDTP